MVVDDKSIFLSKKMVKVLAVNSIPLDHPWLFSGILNDSLFLFIKVWKMFSFL
jgi:hypothetical protein